MLLWDIIRDFFVQYIFGGQSSNGFQYGGLIGGLPLYVDNTFEEVETFQTNTFEIQYFNEPGGFIHSITLGDWLSTTATIIVLIGICFAIWHFVRWLFRLTAGLIRG